MYGNESTFTPTVLVHGLFLRITQGSPLALADRNHFFAASAKAMRWIMVEHARQRAADKRGGGQVMVSLDDQIPDAPPALRSEEQTSELQSLMRISYAVFCLKKKRDRSARSTYCKR